MQLKIPMKPGLWTMLTGHVIYTILWACAPGKPRATAAALAAARACSSHDTAFFDFFLPVPCLLLPPSVGCGGVGRVPDGGLAAGCCTTTGAGGNACLTYLSPFRNFTREEVSSLALQT